MNNSSQLNNERPLVTFALFAYNQEQYIREAIEGAFSQTYEPLEIILSDDCSSDRTFEIMQEMAAAYKGPHQVIARQSDENRGLFNHVLEVAQESHGEYIVVAAGDDISLPERTCMVIPYFKNKKVFALSSDEIVIDENGSPTYLDASEIARRDKLHSHTHAWLNGASAVYRVNFLKLLPMSSEKINFEDSILSKLINAAEGKILRISKALLKYRHHSNNLSCRTINKKDFEIVEENFIRNWKVYLLVDIYCNKVIMENPLYFTNAEKFISKPCTLEYYSLISDWPNLDFISKIKLIICAYRVKKIKTVFPRIFGKKFFLILKKIYKLFVL